MPSDLVGVLLSAALIFLCMGVAFLVAKAGGKAFRADASCDKASRAEASCFESLRGEVARKIVHIGVSNWFFIYYFCFTSSLWAIVGLGAFALINFFLTASGAFSAIFGKQAQKRSWGVVYYPLSLILVLILYELGLGSKLDVGCAILGMGYGDGLAALVGLKWGKKKLFEGFAGKAFLGETFSRSKKTVLGSVTMWVVVALIVFALKSFSCGCSLALAFFSLLIGLVAAIFEAITPFGLDNISVPVVIFLMAGLV